MGGEGPIPDLCVLLQSDVNFGARNLCHVQRYTNSEQYVFGCWLCFVLLCAASRNHNHFTATVKFTCYAIGDNFLSRGVATCILHRALIRMITFQSLCESLYRMQSAGTFCPGEWYVISRDAHRVGLQQIQSLCEILLFMQSAETFCPGEW